MGRIVRVNQRRWIKDGVAHGLRWHGPEPWIVFFESSLPAMGNGSLYTKAGSSHIMDVYVLHLSVALFLRFR